MLYLILFALIFVATICSMTIVFGKGSFFQAMPYCIILLNGIQCIAFGILSMANIGFSGTISLLVNICVCCGCITAGYKTNSKRCSSRIEAWIHLGLGFIASLKNPKDLLVTLAILLFVFVCTLEHFGTDLSLAFLSGDSASHFSSMLAMANGGAVRGQFVFGVSGACIIDSVHQVVDAAYFQKCYIVNEMLWCWLSGQILYSVLLQMAKGLNSAVAAILCMLYIGGYPFYSVVMGFGYFGASIAVVGSLIYAVLSMRAYRMQWIIGVSILLAELAVSYLLFVPPLFFSVFLFLLLGQPGKRLPVSLRAGVCISVFVIPCLFAILLNYNIFFPAGGTDTVSNAINRGGSTYASLYANFLFVAPLSIYGFIQANCTRKRFMRFGLIPLVFIAYCAVLFALAISTVVSPYYFFKTYGILWLLFFAFAGVGIKKLARASLKALLSYCVIWIALLALGISGIEAKFSEKRPGLDPVPVSESLFSLYRFNIDSANVLIFNDNAFVQLSEKSDELSLDGDISVLAGENETRWLGALGYNGKTIRWWDYFDHSKMLDTDTILSFLSDTQYVYIDNSFFSRPYQDSDYSSLDTTAQYIKDNYEVAIETDYGTIYKRK